MRAKFPFEEDIALKRLASVPAEDKPRFNWSELLTSDTLSVPELSFELEGKHQPVNARYIADTVGGALTDLLLSREEKDIYNQKNREFVAIVAAEVVAQLA